MKTSIFELLMHSNPQALADLDSYQRREYGVGIEIYPPQPDLPVNFDYEGTEDDYDREMRLAPSRSRG